MTSEKENVVLYFIQPGKDNVAFSNSICYLPGPAGDGDYQVQFVLNKSGIRLVHDGPDHRFVLCM